MKQKTAIKQISRPLATLLGIPQRRWIDIDDWTVWYERDRLHQIDINSEAVRDAYAFLKRESRERIITRSTMVKGVVA